MPQHSEEQITGQVYLHAEEVYRFSDRLIDGLVETDHIVLSMTVRRGLVYPQSENARAEGAVLSNHLIDIETASRAQKGMHLGGGLWRTGQFWRVPRGLFKLFFSALSMRQILGHGHQNLRRMVP
ncbi:hypothetical protein D9X30_5863 [Cupriavidus sp. U2]|nr:hypothetical protein D9X30_5863 [Cupriavidus sp. U2]